MNDLTDVSDPLFSIKEGIEKQGDKLDEIVIQLKRLNAAIEERTELEFGKGQSKEGPETNKA